MNKHRKSLEKRYRGRCTISNSQAAKVDGETTHKDNLVASMQPCLLIHPKINVANQTEVQAKIKVNYKLIMAPEITVLPGSKITVTQDGATYKLSCSGKPFIRSSHQQIELLEEGHG
ncbi:hypothetical protein [Vallitalea sp.]|jgi:hypothetical protein|uniref:hypothetical protein n=1 Tax=Vallitalea sp. TaxID=1882829 RepID=UPI0025F600C8|nr:hypothetical protein [Vallitalea sp.]MCT4686079.1 hypothetical protein [Vallitalea sp.]